MAPTYLASILTAPAVVEFLDLPLPRLKKHECLIRVSHAGVCGTDLAIYSGLYPVPLPLTLGHEFAGVVEKVGDSRFSSLAGQAVTAEINNTCLALGAARPCANCRAGRDHHCSRRTVVGIIAAAGAFAQYIVVPSRNVHLLPPRWPLRAGVMIEPLAAALQTFVKTPLRKGDNVVVLGVGRLGLLVALVAGKMGARVLPICRTGKTRERARRLGVAAEALATEEETIEGVKRFSGGNGADIVVEATGDSRSLALALKLVRPEGAIAIKSTPGAPADAIDLTKAVVDEVTIQGSRCGPFARAIAFARRHRINLDDFITDEYPLEALPAAFERAAQGGKVVVTMRP